MERTGRGLAEEYAVADKIEIQMGTLGKALGSAGGYICGSERLIDFLINRARSFIFSTAPVPAASAAASAAIDILQSDRGIQLRKALWQRIDQFCDAHKNGQIQIHADRSRLDCPRHHWQRSQSDGSRAQVAITRNLRPRRSFPDGRARPGATAHHFERRSFRRRHQQID